MTNLDIIKHLATNNPTRLAGLLDDIYCTAWNCGSYAGSNGEGKILEECEIDDFEEWLYEDASKSGFYYDEEFAEWGFITIRDCKKCEYYSGRDSAHMMCSMCDDFEYFKFRKKENKQ